MLYDEQGRAYVECPIIPEEQHLMYIVKDYRRMYNEHGKMLEHIKKLQDTNTKLAHHNYSLVRKNQEQRDVIRHCVKWMKKNGIKPSPFLDNYAKQNIINYESIRTISAATAADKKQEGTVEQRRRCLESRKDLG